MTTIDQQFVEYIVKSLVGNPEAVSIERRIDEKGVLLELTVDPEDLGRVIGKRGATAQSLRTLLRALGTKNEARYNLKIIDNGEPRPPREDRGDNRNSAPMRNDGPNESMSQDNSADDTSNDSTSSDDNAADNTVTPASGDGWGANSTPAATSSASDDLDLDDEDMESKSSGDKLSRTREELKDLDDLDV